MNFSLIKVLFLGLISFGFFICSNASAATVACSSLWLNGFPEQGYVADAGNCHGFVPASTSLHGGQKLYFQNESIDIPEAKTRLEWAADALVYSSSKYESYGLVPQIRIIYSPRPHQANAEHMAFSYVEFFQLPHEYCPIIIYPASLSLSKDHFYQMIAHEVYHCVQKNSFPLQTSAAVQGTSQGLFWFEGIAQFMSNEVYPASDFEYHPMFGRFDGRLPIFQQSSPYLTEGFFQGLFWFMGSSPAQMHSLQNLFSTGGASDAQDIMAIPRISEAFHEIGRRISFLELNDSSGTLSPWRVEKQFITVSEDPTSVATISFIDFGIQPFEISFPRGGEYQVTVRRPDGAKLSLRKVGTPLWEEGGFPSSFVSECDSERKFEGVYTRDAEDYGLNTVTLEITRRENTSCACRVETTPTDTCLFGSWQVDHNNMREFMNKLSNGKINITSTSGSLKLLFNPDGTHSSDYQNLKINAVTNGGGPGTAIQWTWNGVQNLIYTDYKIGADKKLCGVGVSGEVIGRATMTVGGQVIEIPTQATSFTGQGRLTYTCDERNYKYTVDTGSFVHTWIYNR